MDAVTQDLELVTVVQHRFCLMPGKAIINVVRYVHNLGAFGQMNLDDVMLSMRTRVLAMTEGRNGY